MHETLAGQVVVQHGGARTDGPQAQPDPQHAGLVHEVDGDDLALLDGIALLQPGGVATDHVVALLVGPVTALVDEEGPVGDLGLGRQGNVLEEVEGRETITSLVEALVDLGGDEGADHGDVVADHVFRVEVGDQWDDDGGGLEEGGGGHWGGCIGGGCMGGGVRCEGWGGGGVGVYGGTQRRRRRRSRGREKRRRRVGGGEAEVWGEYRDCWGLLGADSLGRRRQRRLDAGHRAGPRPGGVGAGDYAGRAQLRPGVRGRLRSAVGGLLCSQAMPRLARVRR